MKNVFCFGCKQRGHVFSECKERKTDSGNKAGMKDKSGARIFALQYEEEAPTIDTCAGMFCSVYTLVDTGASHSCISEECVLACDLTTETLLNVDMRVSTPLGLGSEVTKVVRSVGI